MVLGVVIPGSLRGEEQVVEPSLSSWTPGTFSSGRLRWLRKAKLLGGWGASVVVALAVITLTHYRFVRRRHGRFLLFNLSPGKHDLEVTADGKTMRVTVNVPAGQATPPLSAFHLLWTRTSLRRC